MSLIQRISNFLEEAVSTDTECKHNKFDQWPDPEKSMCYLKYEEEVGDLYWVETDVTFVKTRQLRRKYICLGCGEETVRQSSETVGGVNALKLKEEMSPKEIREYQGKGGGVSYNK